MKKKVALISLRFSPAFIQHLIAYAKAMKELGHDPEFLLDRGYRDFPELEVVACLREADADTLAVAWEYAVFLNPSPENGNLANALKRKGTKILYVYHEPWQMSFDFIWSQGLIGTLKLIMAHHVTVPALTLADTVILPSRNALRVYQKSDARYNRNSIYFPLIYDDEENAAIPTMLEQKRYFGYIGNLCRSHGFDHYLSFVRFAFQRNLNISFLIASRNRFPSRVMNDPLFSRNSAKIEILCGKPLGNADINLCYAKSICVWNLYRTSTQSGVLPKAFMFGTPVIASKIGSFPEFIQEGVNGRFASARDHEGTWTAFEEIRSNLGMYAANSRKTFLETFYYRPHLGELGRLLD
jgi:glycosyltransferase involved in cell wall biosynthesis